VTSDTTIFCARKCAAHDAFSFGSGEAPIHEGPCDSHCCAIEISPSSFGNIFVRNTYHLNKSDKSITSLTKKNSNET
jgi:hypothetical protein